MLDSIKRFLGADPRLLVFGMATALGTSFGQTYFIALSGGEIRENFALSHGGYGAVYSAATLMSAAALIWTGKLIDKLDLRLWCAIVVAGLAAACALMGTVQGIAGLVIAIFMLRQFGQGLLSHIGSTSLARYYAEGRGRAVGLGGAGYPIGEGAFPIMAVLVMAAVGWRDMWLICAGVMLVLFLPLQQWLLAGHSARQTTYLKRVADEDREDAEADAREAVSAAEPRAAGAAPTPQAGRRRGRSWTRPQVLRDPRFYLVLPAMLAPSFVITGIFFHQVHLAEVKGWSLAAYSSAFVGYAIATVPAGFLYGMLIDRIGAARALPYFLPPMLLACLVLAFFDHPVAAWVFMLLAGANAGMTQTLSAAFWAEVYGTRHLGAVRALTQALMVFATGASPWIMGAFIDLGVTMERIVLMCALYTLIGVGLSILGRRRYSPAAY